MSIDLRPSLLKALDSAIQPMQAARCAVIRPSRGWLKAIRESLGLSHAAVANKIGISRQAYFEIEQREDREKISIVRKFRSKTLVVPLPHSNASWSTSLCLRQRTRRRSRPSPPRRTRRRETLRLPNTQWSSRGKGAYVRRTTRTSSWQR